MSRSAPTSRGLSVRTGIPSFMPGATNRSRPWKYRSFSQIHSWSCCGTTDATIAPSMSSNVMPRSRSSAAMRIASSSEVVVREVAKRKWSASSSPRNMPKWVWVLPTSMVRSTRGLSETSEAAYALALQLRQGVGERAPARRIQLEERLQHEAALLDFGMRHAVIRPVDAGPLDDENVDVDRPRRVARRVRIASQLDLRLLGRCEELIGLELRLDLDAGVEEIVLPDGTRLRLG